MTFTGYLSQTELDALYDAAFRTGLANPMMLGSLLTGMNPFFAATLQNVALPAPAQLLTTLQRLNTTERLTDGSVPLQQWLANAVKLAGPVEDAQPFARALTKVTQQATGAPSIPNVATLPERKERIVHQDDMVPFSFFAGGLAAGQAVAHLRVPRYDAGAATMLPGGPYLNIGTAWLITPELAVTNHHVVNARHLNEPQASQTDLTLQATHSLLYFDFDDPAMLPSPVGVAKLEALDAALDYAILRLAQSQPPSRRPLRVKTAAIPDRAPVNIIQHPLGGAKRVACRNNLVTASAPTELRYFTDTEAGSSGAPVFDDTWHVVALHRASVDVTGVSFQGKTTAWVNLGTPLGAIFQDLQQRAPTLWQEFQAAQAV